MSLCKFLAAIYFNLLNVFRDASQSSLTDKRKKTHEIFCKRLTNSVKLCKNVSSRFRVQTFKQYFEKKNRRIEYFQFFLNFSLKILAQNHLMSRNNVKDVKAG